MISIIFQRIINNIYMNIIYFLYFVMNYIILQLKLFNPCGEIQLG
jgi:hypothetical protein